MAGLLAVFAEFKREIRGERVRAGLACSTRVGLVSAWPPLGERSTLARPVNPSHAGLPKGHGGLAQGNPQKGAAPLFLQKDIEQGVVYPNLAVIFDEPQFSEAIHEKTHA